MVTTKSMRNWISKMYKKDSSQDVFAYINLNLYGLVSFLFCSILYSKYFSGINPASMGDYYYYVKISFWLNFLVFWLLAVFFAKLVFYLTPGHKKTGFIIVGGMSILITIWVYVDSQVHTLLNLHVSRYFIEALMQKDALDQIGLGVPDILLGSWSLLVFLLPHFFIKQLSNIKIYAFGKKLFLYLFLVIIGFVLLDKLAYGYYYFVAKPFVFELKNSPLIYPTLHPYYISGFYQRVTGGASRSGFHGKLQNELVDANATLKNIVYPVNKIPENKKIEKPYNIIVIVAESLRASDFNSLTAPKLNEIKRHEIFAENHYSASNCTHFGLFSLFYGINPHYFHDFRLSKQMPIGVQLLKDNGYDINVTLSRTMQWYDLDAFMFGADYKTYEPNLESNIERDRAVTEKAISLAQQYSNSNQRYLNFVYYYATHADYQHPDEFSRFEPELKGRINFADRELKQKQKVLLNRYKNSIGFVDHEVGRLIESLKKTGAWENTILIFTGDHGEEFFEENKYGHNSSLNSYQTQVPFLMHIPNHDPAVIKTLTSHMDVFQTIMEVLQSPKEIYSSFQGESMLSVRKSPLIIGMAHYQRPEKYAILKDNRKTTVDFSDGSPRVESVVNINDGQNENVRVVESDIMYLLQQLRQLKRHSN